MTAVSSSSTTATSAFADPYAELIALARSTTSRHVFFRHALECIGRSFGTPFATMSVRQGAEVISHEYHSGPTAPKFWREDVRQFVSEGLLDVEQAARTRRMSARQGQLNVVFMCTPLVEPHGQSIGALAVVCASTQEIDVQRRVTLLESLGRVVSALGATVGQAAVRERDDTVGAARQALAQTAQLGDPKSLAYSITNNLRNKLGCVQVAFAMVRRGRLEILSISGLDDVSTKSAAVAGLRAAMEECLDAGQIIVCEHDRSWAGGEQCTVQYVLHRVWHKHAGGEGVASIPLAHAGVTQAIVSLRYSERQRYEPHKLEDIRKRVEAFMPAMALAYKATRSVRTHVTDTLRDTITGLWQGSAARFVTALLVAAGVVGLLFGSADYRLVVPAVVVPAQVHHVTAPSDGRLIASHVVEGQHVRAGTVLCELDSAVLQLERNELRAEIEVLTREVDRARSQSRPADAAVFESERRVLEVRLRATEQRIAECVVRAPQAGIIVAGDLREQIGNVLARGTPFYRIATGGDWKLELRVGENDVEDIKAGLIGSFALNARPNTRHDLEVSTVSPQVTTVDQRAVCVAEARVALPHSWVRPGMEGIARVHVGSRRLWWIVLHRAIDRVYMAVWF